MIIETMVEVVQTKKLAASSRGDLIMATFYEYSVKYIEDRKTPPTFTEMIMGGIKNDPENQCVADVWADNTSNHPDEYLAVFLLTVVNPGVLAWMDEIWPDHYARPAFEIGGR